jgi:hypothetical protein
VRQQYSMAGGLITMRKDVCLRNNPKLLCKSAVGSQKKEKSKANSLCAALSDKSICCGHISSYQYCHLARDGCRLSLLDSGCARHGVVGSVGLRKKYCSDEGNLTRM